MSDLPSIRFDTTPPSVVDPLAWLEGDGPEVEAWLAGQRQRTRAALAALPGSLEAVRDANKDARSHSWQSVPLGRGGRWFFHARPEGAERVAVHVADSLLGLGRPLLTQERFDDARGLASIGAFYPSPDGRHLIASVFRGDRDATELVLVSVDDGAILDRLDMPTAAFAVWHDNASYFWSHGTTLALRRLDGGEIPVPFPADGERIIPITSDDLRWLFVSLHAPELAGPRIFLAANTPTPEFHEVTGPDMTRARMGWWGSRGPILLVRNADGFREVFEADMTVGGAPVLRHRHTDDTGTLVTAMAAPTGDVLLFLRALGGGDRLRHLAPDGTVEEIPFEAGTSIKETTIERSTGAMLASVQSWRTSRRLLQYDFTARRFTVLREAEAGLDVEVETVHIGAEDGAAIPVTLIRPAAFAQARDLPCLLIAYGAFGARLEPWCLKAFQPWFDAGGMIAHAHVRGGGGGGGQGWHKAARGPERKMISFTDLVAVCRGLEAAGHTTRRKLCLYGIGAGGLLVLGGMALAPDLCAGVIADNPITDMANFPRWGYGTYWLREFGDPATDLAAIARWSPLHNLKAATPYPPTLVITAPDGDNVSPVHGRKMAAALQATGADGPFLLWDDGASGPAGAVTLTGQALEWAVIEHFAAGAVGLPLTPVRGV